MFSTRINDDYFCCTKLYIDHPWMYIAKHVCNWPYLHHNKLAGIDEQCRESKTNFYMLNCGFIKIAIRDQQRNVKLAT